MATSYTACHRALKWESPQKLKNERDTLRKVFDILKRKDASQVIQVTELERKLANTTKELDEARGAAQEKEVNSQIKIESLRSEFDELRKAFDVLKHKDTTQTGQVKGCERIVTKTRKELAEVQATAQETEARLQRTILTLSRRLENSAESTKSLGVEDLKATLSDQSNTSSEAWQLFLDQIEGGLAAIRTTLGVKNKAIQTLHEENIRLTQAKKDLRSACQNLKRKHSLSKISTNGDPGEVVKKMRFDKSLEHRPAQNTGHDEPIGTASVETCEYKNYYNSYVTSISNGVTVPTVTPDTTSSTDQPATQNHQGCESFDQHAIAWLDQNIA